MDALRIILSILVPGLTGIAALQALQPPSRTLQSPGQLAWIIGVGYVLGAFLLTLWMRALSLMRVHFGVAVIALPVLVIAAGLFWLVHRRCGSSIVRARTIAVEALRVPKTGRALRIVWWFLIAWLALRFALLAIEVSLRPLYPWDAWIQWATKARVWYELGYLAPFGRAEAWLTSNGALYFDASPEYPPTMPLLQVWSCLALGRWNDSLMNWPWWMLLLSLVLAIYGGLRVLGIGALASLTASTMVATLPLADVHVALAGYADMPMAVYYTIAVLALLRWSESREGKDAALVILVALACTQVKNPGVVWALTLVPAIIVILMPRRGLRVAGTLFGAAVLLLAIFAQTDPVIFNYRLHLDFNPSWAALGQTYFLLDNWHLLWYAVVAATLLAWRDLFAPPVAPITMIMVAGLLFLFLVFGFTNARIWVSDQTTVNRATLHFAPVALVFAVLAFHAFARRWSARRAPTSVEISTPPPEPQVAV